MHLSLNLHKKVIAWYIRNDIVCNSETAPAHTGYFYAYGN